MKINIDELIQIVKRTKPHFEDTGAAGQVTVKGVSDYVTQVDFHVQEQLGQALAEENFRNFKEIFLSCQDIRRIGSAAIDLAYVASGRVEAYFERNLKPWDYAAGLLLVQEAGGTVTDFEGRPVALHKPSDIVAGNGTVGEELVLRYLSKRA